MLVQRVSSATIIMSGYSYGTQSDCDKCICRLMLVLWEGPLSGATVSNPQPCSYQGLLTCNVGGRFSSQPGSYSSALLKRCKKGSVYLQSENV